MAELDLISRITFITTVYIKDMDIALIRHPDYEGNNNRGFTMDAIELLVDGRPAGYLKISYVPFHRVIQWTGMDAAQAAIEYQAAACDISENDLLALEKPLGMPPVVSPQRLLKAWNSLHGRGNLKAGSVSFHVDRPLVDYICVYGPDDFFNRVPPLRFHNRRDKREYIEHDYRRHGFGTLLYVEGAKWMAERSMLLHASGLQTTEAETAWKRMREKFGNAIQDFPGLPDHNGETPVRTALDGSLLQDWKPYGMTVEYEERPAGIPSCCMNYEDLSECQLTDIRKSEEELRVRGIEPLGGELFPSSPRGALAHWEEANQSAHSPGLGR